MKSSIEVPETPGTPVEITEVLLKDAGFREVVPAPSETELDPSDEPGPLAEPSGGDQ